MCFNNNNNNNCCCLIIILIILLLFCGCGFNNCNSCGNVSGDNDNCGCC